jgi:serine/threonine protein kinase
MWEMKSLAHYNLKTKYQILGRPLKTWAPWDNTRHRRSGDIVRSIKVPESQLQETIYLGDFGMAFQAGQHKHQVMRPMTFCAPERLHGVTSSPASDMWSYMCILSQLFFGKHPFTNASTPSMLMIRLFESFGPLPSEWKGRYTEDGTVSDSCYGLWHGYPPGFHNTIANDLPHHISPKEWSHLESVLSRGFQYHPTKRITAAQLLKDPSFVALTATA